MALTLKCMQHCVMMTHPKVLFRTVGNAGWFTGKHLGPKSFEQNNLRKAALVAEKVT